MNRRYAQRSRAVAITARQLHLGEYDVLQHREHLEGETDAKSDLEYLLGQYFLYAQIANWDLSGKPQPTTEFTPARRNIFLSLAVARFAGNLGRAEPGAESLAL